MVTGGSGFIGRHLVVGLASAHDVLAPTHAELELTDADAVREWFRDHSVDAVVHAAVKPGHRNAPDRTALAERNLRQFFSLVRCRESFGRFVVLSSGAVYGVQRSVVEVPESAFGEAVPGDEHGFSKYVEALWLEHDADVVELRPFGVYGPGEDYAIRFISNACCKALLGLPVTLRQDRRFSYVWVEDLVAVVKRALDVDGGLRAGAYNVTPGPPVSLRAAAELVVAASGKDVPVRVAREGLGLEYSGDDTKLKRALPEQEFASVARGVERLLSWYGARLDALERSVLEIDG